MFRILVAVALLVTTFSVSLSSGRPASTPISIELAEGNFWALLLFLSLGAAFMHFSVYCRRVGWKVLSWIAGLLIPLLIVIGFTGPQTTIHLAAFGILLVAGVVWMIAYAEADHQRSISILAILLVFACLALLFIIAILSSLIDVSSISPLGLLQKGFLLLLGALALRPPNISVHRSESEGIDPPSRT